MEETIDPTTNIINRTDEYVEYLNTEGKQWRIYGQCNGCGKCEYTNGIAVGSGDFTLQYNRILLLDGSLGDWYRSLHWNSVPGEPGACIEDDFDKRKDIPVTPDCVNEIPECSLSGVWLSGN